MKINADKNTWEKYIGTLGRRHRRLLIVGNSWHGKVIKDLASQIGCYQDIEFADDNLRQKGGGSVVGVAMMFRGGGHQ